MITQQWLKIPLSNKNSTQELLLLIVPGEKYTLEDIRK